MERALTHCTNAYKVPHAKLTGKICQTNTPSNTAFRGFGGPQGMMMVEDLMDRAAYELNMDPAEVNKTTLCIFAYFQFKLTTKTIAKV